MWRRTEHGRQGADRDAAVRNRGSSIAHHVARRSTCFPVIPLTFAEFTEVMEAFVAVPDDFEDETDCPRSLLRPVLKHCSVVEFGRGN